MTNSKTVSRNASRTHLNEITAELLDGTNGVAESGDTSVIAAELSVSLSFRDKAMSEVSADEIRPITL